MPTFFVEKYNFNTKQYELQHPYTPNRVYESTEMIPADLYPHIDNTALFSIVIEQSKLYPRMQGIHHGVPEDVSTYIANQLPALKQEQCSWFTYADLAIYLLNNPTVRDYQKMEQIRLLDDPEEPVQELNTASPLFALKKRVDAFLSVMNPDGFEDEYSTIRIVYFYYAEGDIY